MDWTPLSLNTLTTQIPKIFNDNFTSFKRYLDLFYDEDGKIIVVPVNTTGRVKAATGEFVNVITDNLTVKKQFTNWYDNYTTVDAAFIDSFNGDDTTTRIAAVDASGFSTWPLEPSAYTWIDVQTPYIKIDNDASYGLQNDVVGQEFRLLFNTDVSTTAPYTILVDSSEGGEQNLAVLFTDASTTWIKLITTAWDASYGPKWTVKEYGGTYTIS